MRKALATLQSPAPTQSQRSTAADQMFIAAESGVATGALDPVAAPEPPALGLPDLSTCPSSADAPASEVVSMEIEEASRPEAETGQELNLQTSNLKSSVESA